MAKTLKMVFGLDSGKDYTLNLAEPKSDIARANVEPVMQSIIDKQAFLIGTTTPVGIKSAFVREVTDTKLI